MTVALRVVSGHELTQTRTCAEPGCGEDAIGNKDGGYRGVGAFCAEHKQQRLGALKRSRERAAAAAAVESNGVGIYEVRAQTLTKMARDLDVALAIEAEAVTAAEKARSRYRAGLLALARAEGVL